MGPYYNMWMLVGSRHARNVSNPTADDGVAELAEGHAERRIGDPGEPLIEPFDLAWGECGFTRFVRRRIEGHWSLHQRQATDYGTAEKKIDALDQQRRAMLEFESCTRRHTQLQGAVATERVRPSQRGPFGADDRCPLRL
jgi:hypothetical protein